MHYTGTIYADGRITLDGFTPEDTRLIGITRTMIAIHHPGGRWWDNGGEHYGPAHISVHELESLTRGNKARTYRFCIKRGGSGVSFHPTRKKAVKVAVERLEDLKL